MKRSLGICLLLCSLCPSMVFAQDDAAEPPPLSRDAIVLFGSQADFAKWKGKDNWTVEGNVIVGTNPKEDPIAEHNYLIFKEAEFDNFELSAQFKIEGEGGNSGIQYRGKVVDEDKFKVAGYQGDIDFNNRYAGILYEQDGRGILAKRGQSVIINDEGKKTPKSFGDETELGKSIHPGQWNDYRIVAVGNRLEHYINGQLTVRVVDRQSEKSSSKGVIALQLHKGPPMKVSFKNLVLRKINAPQ